MGDADGSITGGAFHNTNIMDRESMSSPNAEMARQKSQEVMAALKKNDGSADKLMKKSDDQANGNPVGGFRNWIKNKLGPGHGGNSAPKPAKSRARKSEETGGIEGLKGNAGGIGIEDSSGGMVIGDPAPTGDVLARDGGKGDGVIR